jgi:hypothetical protein
LKCKSFREGFVLKTDYLIAITILLALNSTKIFAQFPLEIGNRWDFNNYYVENYITHQEESSVEIVKKDSIMPNGIKYFLLEGRGSFIPDWVRIDTNWIFIYDTFDSTDNALFNFSAEVGDSFYNNKMGYWVSLNKKDTVTIFNQETVRFSFVSYLGFDNINEAIFSDKLGLLGGSNYFYGEVNYSVLSGCIIGDSTYGKLVSVDESSPNTVSLFNLFQNYPNPFNPNTKIQFFIPEAGKVKIDVFNILGQRVKNLLDKELQSGDYDVDFDGTGLASGMYIYTIEVKKKFFKARKMSLMK